MRRIDLKELKSRIIEAIVKMNYHLSDDMCKAFNQALQDEDNELAKKVLNELIDMIYITNKNNIINTTILKA